jgi:2-dehydro-3-deoxygluconokinase
MVLSFGELLLRICPDTEGEWLQQNSLPFYVGGAEANVATALALWGVPSGYATAVPDNLMTRQILDYLGRKGIDTSKIHYAGQRLGLYFLPKGKDLKNAAVIYDRAHSAFAELKPAVLDWDQILKGVSWLHFSAISPALNSQVAAVCEEGLRAAAAKKISISVDLNYRAKLWQYGASPEEVMPGLVQYCDLVMGNLWAAEKMLGIPVDTAEIHEKSKREDYLRHARATSEKIKERFPKVSTVANTFRFDRGASGIHYYTTLFSEDELYTSIEHDADKIVDKVGSGDCFMAGLIYGLHRKRPLQETLEFATAAAFQKLFIASDATDQKAGDIEKYLRTLKEKEKYEG